MKLSQLISRVRRQIPNATIDSVPNEDITTELNVGVDKCNILTRVYRGSKDITLVAEQQVYSLSEEIPDFLGMEKSGVWYYTSSSAWKYLFAKTRRWMDLYFRTWRDASSGEPNWYWIYVDELGFYPKPSTATTARVHYVKKSTPMDNLDNYPWFNNTTGSGVFTAFDDAIVAYACWALTTSIGKEANKETLWNEFLKQTDLARMQVKASPHLTSDYDFYMRIDGQKS